VAEALQITRASDARRNARGAGGANLENDRIRALLDAGRPNGRVLGSIVVR
jgi:hypothetical protein